MPEKRKKKVTKKSEPEKSPVTRCPKCHTLNLVDGKCRICPGKNAR